MDALFTLVRTLAARLPITDVESPKWLVQRHGLAPLAARAGALTYRDDLVAATALWSRTEADLPLLVTRLVDAGVRVAPIKGVAYAKRLYSAAAERPMQDVDLLVRRVDLGQARTVLRNLGFVPSHRRAVLHHAEPWVRGSLAIDLHWNILAVGRGRIALDTVWSRMSPAWPPGAEGLESTDLLLFHLLHLARNRLRLPLINIVDAARLLEHADVPLTHERAVEWRVSAAVNVALQLCTAILEGRRGRLAGWRGPSRSDVIEIAPPSAAGKMLFDATIAGSPLQLTAQVVHVGANQLRELLRRFRGRA